MTRCPTARSDRNSRQALPSLFFAALLVSVGSVTGCGPEAIPLFPVSGRVTRADGKPLSGGIVVFESGKLNAEGPIGEDGSYTLTTLLPKGESGAGAVAGPHRVMIIPGMKSSGLTKYEEVISRRYFAFSTSNLSANVEAKPEGNTIDFLKLDPPGR